MDKILSPTEGEKVDVIVDTNIIIGLAKVINGKRAQNKEQTNSLIWLYRLYNDGKINLCYTNDIYLEVIQGSKFDKGLGEAFIKKHCKHVSVPSDNTLSFNRLLILYGNKKYRTSGNSKKQTPIPFGSEKEKNYVDAIVAATGAVLGMPVITFNIKHFGRDDIRAQANNDVGIKPSLVTTPKNIIKKINRFNEKVKEKE